MSTDTGWTGCRRVVRTASCEQHAALIVQGPRPFIMKATEIQISISAQQMLPCVYEYTSYSASTTAAVQLWIYIFFCFHFLLLFHPMSYYFRPISPAPCLSDPRYNTAESNPKHLGVQAVSAEQNPEILRGLYIIPKHGECVFSQILHVLFLENAFSQVLGASVQYCTTGIII